MYSFKESGFLLKSLKYDNVIGVFTKLPTIKRLDNKNIAKYIHNTKLFYINLKTLIWLTLWKDFEIVLNNYFELTFLGVYYIYYC